jgi:serine/threonine protein kinase
MDMFVLCLNCIFEGDLVEVKKLHISPLSLRTKVMRELRLLKDLRFENVNTFIGLFIDPHAPALIFDYGQRGSLEVRSLFQTNII